MSDNNETTRLLHQIDGLKRELEMAQRRETENAREICILKNQLETLVRAVAVFLNNNRYL